MPPKQNRFKTSVAQLQKIFKEKKLDVNTKNIENTVNNIKSFIESDKSWKEVDELLENLAAASSTTTEEVFDYIETGRVKALIEHSGRGRFEDIEKRLLFDPKTKERLLETEFVESEEEMERTRSQIGKYSKAKGSRFELQVANLLAQFFHTANDASEAEAVYRTAQVKGTGSSADVESTAQGLKDWFIECKYRNHLNISQYMQELFAVAPADKVPVIISKKSHGLGRMGDEILVTFPLLKLAEFAKSIAKIAELPLTNAIQNYKKQQDRKYQKKNPL